MVIDFLAKLNLLLFPEDAELVVQGLLDLLLVVLQGGFYLPFFICDGVWVVHVSVDLKD